MPEYGRVGVIARFKPLHAGAATMLEAVCEQADTVLIGIGSANKYNLRNPFTAAESEEMIHHLLQDRFTNYSVFHIHDYGHLPGGEGGQLWKQVVAHTFGSLDAFVTANPYTASLLEDTYTIVHPATIIHADRWVKVDATTVRKHMARGGDAWKQVVPAPVAAYMEQEGLLHRFRTEFGLATLAAAEQSPITAEDERTAVLYK
jgi:nicotinamide mononucleotide adenylyltransferase